MNENLAIFHDMLLLRVSFAPRIMHIAGQAMTVHELGRSLPFARKPVNLSDFACGAPQRVFVHRHHPLNPCEFDEFANHLTRARHWLDGTAFAVPYPRARACVMVTSPERPVLFVDSEGHDYARYVARFG